MTKPSGFDTRTVTALLLVALISFSFLLPPLHWIVTPDYYHADRAVSAGATTSLVRPGIGQSHAPDCPVCYFYRFNVRVLLVIGVAASLLTISLVRRKRLSNSFVPSALFGVSLSNRSPPVVPSV